MGSRRISRVASLQILYLADLCRMTADEAKSIIYNGSSFDLKVREFCESLANGVIGNRERIDEVIVKYAENWEISRMAAIDRNILRLASFELIFNEQTPVNVIIDEAVEIAKHYSTSDSGKFVNGILDKIKNERKAK